MWFLNGLRVASSARFADLPQLLLTSRGAEGLRHLAGWGCMTAQPQLWRIYVPCLFPLVSRVPLCILFSQFPGLRAESAWRGSFIPSPSSFCLLWAMVRFGLVSQGSHALSIPVLGRGKGGGDGDVAKPHRAFGQLVNHQGNWGGNRTQGPLGKKLLDEFWLWRTVEGVSGQGGDSMERNRNDERLAKTGSTG